MKKSFRRLDTLRLEDRLNPSTYVPPTYFLFDPSQLRSQPSQAAPLDIARTFLADRAADFGASAADFADAKVSSQYTDADTGITHVYFRQMVNGLEVAYADMNVSLAKDGRVISAGGGFVPGLADSLDENTRVPLNSPLQAIDWAQAALAVTDNQPQPGCICSLCITSFIRMSEDEKLVPNQVFMVTANVEHEAVIASPVSDDNITAKLHYVPTPDGSAELAWNLIIRTKDGKHWYDLSIADRTGIMSAVSDWVDDAAYNVLAAPADSPQDGGFAVLAEPQNVGASSFGIPSPFGWHDTNGVAGPEFTDTRGNNVSAQLDRDANNTPDPSPGRPTGTSTLDFSNYTFDPGSSPLTLQNQNVAQVNLFYLNNFLHDVHYAYGFTPVAGNFQTNNYGLGGAGNDAVQADAQDGSGTNNANFGTPPDGSAPRMQQFIFTAATPDRDSGLDNGIVYHEYGHGVSNRLTGGPANSNALNSIQSGGMGEGWSDFYALMFTQTPTDVISASYPMGTYALNQPITGTGIRRFAYSFNMSNNPLMFDAYGSGTTSYGVSRTTAVHASGELWASTLWDLNWLLIGKYGYNSDLNTGWSATPGPANAGNKLALRLVMDGMKLQPANPSFVQARDAILAADTALTGGANHLQIWQAFARRGLGSGAVDAGSSSTATITADNTIPATALQIVSHTPGPLSVVSTAPTSFTLNVTEALNPTSVAASDLTVNGIAATSVSYTAGSTTVTFTFATTPVTTQGQQLMEVAAGAFTRASDSDPVQAFAGTFRYDTLTLQVSNSTPTGTLQPTITTVDLNLNEPVLPGSVSVTDLRLSQGYATGVSFLNGNQTIRYTVTGLANEAAQVNVTLLASAFTDVNGNPSAAYTSSFALDYVTRPFTGISAINPLGSQNFKGTLDGLVNNSTDTDEFTFSVEAGQVIGATITPASGLRPRITILSPTSTVLSTTTAASNGLAVATPPLIATVSGTYTLRAQSAGSTSGTYSVDLLLNAIAETETLQSAATNHTAATAQSLTASQLDQSTSLGSAKRLAALGTTDSATIYTAAPIAHNFEDITATGTTILANADDANTSISIPFAFNFYGTNYTTAFVSDNGLITFGSGSVDNANTDLTSTPTQAAIAVLWDDLVTNASGVKWQVLGSTGSRRVVVQWDNVRYWTSGGTGTHTLKFQAVLFEGTNEIRLSYQELDGNITSRNQGGSATVGIKSDVSGTRLLLSQNNATSDFHGDGKTTLISPPVATKDFYSFSAAAGDTLSLVASALTAGTLGVELFDTNGTSLLATGVAGATNFTRGVAGFTVPASGTYFVAVSGGTTIIPYSLTVVVDAAFDAEANSTAATAQVLGDSRSAFGSLTAGNDDWYSIVLPATSTILKVETATPGGAANVLNPTLELYNAAGTMLIASGTVLPDGRNEALTATGLTPGATYKVRLSSSATSGEYLASWDAPPAPVVQSVVINDGAIQRSRVRSIDVVFSNAVIIPPGAFTLTRGATVLSSGPGGGILASSGLVGSQTVASLTFDSVAGIEVDSLSDGVWTLTVTAAGITSTVDGQPMLANSTHLVKRLFGDSDGNGTVNATDFADLGSAFGATFLPDDLLAAFDANGDGTVDADDLGQFGNRFGITL